MYQAKMEKISHTEPCHIPELRSQRHKEEQNNKGSGEGVKLAPTDGSERQHYCSSNEVILFCGDK